MVRVLVVDDKSDIRLLLVAVLQRAGHEVVEAADGTSVSSWVKDANPDLIILDLMMPVMGGLTFLKKLRKDPLHMGLPVFVLTGKAITEDESEMLKELASAVLFKDDAPEQLGELLGSIFSLADAQG